MYYRQKNMTPVRRRNNNQEKPVVIKGMAKPVSGKNDGSSGYRSSFRYRRMIS